MSSYIYPAIRLENAQSGRPLSSFIIKIKAAEVVSSDLYSLGFTMRFPRALSIRDDLTVADCMTATGTPISVSSDGTVIKPNNTGVLENIRSEKKRKMEDNDEWVSCSAPC